MNESAGSFDPKHILVVEDMVSVAELMQEMLLSFGYRVQLCPVVEDALAKFAPGKYDLIITDFTMPGMNGFEFAHLVRKQAPEQLILLITGSNFAMTEGGAHPQPVDAVLAKPFSVAEFQSCVASLLKKLARENR